MVDLSTTNILLGIMAAVSLIEAAALIVAGIMGMRMYRELNEQIRTIEQRHVAPLTAKALPLLEEGRTLAEEGKVLAAEAKALMQSAQRIALRVEHSTSRMDEAVQDTMDKAEQAVDKVQGGVRKTAGTVIGVVRGVRTAIETFLTDHPNGSRSHARNGATHAESSYPGSETVPPVERPM
jgi:Asp-tRNA(Asn)/Glu-tRNA(Gln) amidotransferase B subunit